MAVAYDADTQGLQNISVDTVSFSHTCTGTNRGLAGWVAMLGVAETVTAFTYSGVALGVVTGSPLDLTGATPGRLASHYLHAPATGSNTVQVTLSAANSAWDVSVLSVTGAHQSAAVSGYQEGLDGGLTAITVVVTSATGDLVVDATVSTSDNGTTSSGTQRWQDNSGMTNTQGATASGAASVNVTENWDGAPDPNIHGVAAFNIAQAAAGGTTDGWKILIH